MCTISVYAKKYPIYKSLELLETKYWISIRNVWLWKHGLFVQCYIPYIISSSTTSSVHCWTWASHSSLHALLALSQFQPMLLRLSLYVVQSFFLWSPYSSFFLFVSLGNTVLNENPPGQTNVLLRSFLPI